MTAISIPMMLTGVLLIINAFLLVNLPILMVIDLAVSVYLLWNCITHIDPPSDGAFVEIRG